MDLKEKDTVMHAADVSFLFGTQIANVRFTWLFMHFSVPVPDL